MAKAKTECCICGRGLPHGASLYRVNKIGEGIKGIWACEHHISSFPKSAQPDGETLAIVRAITGKSP